MNILYCPILLIFDAFSYFLEKHSFVEGSLLLVPVLSGLCFWHVCVIGAILGLLLVAFVSCWGLAFLRLFLSPTGHWSVRDKNNLKKSMVLQKCRPSRVQTRTSSLHVGHMQTNICSYPFRGPHTKPTSDPPQPQKRATNKENEPQANNKKNPGPQQEKAETRNW